MTTSSTGPFAPKPPTLAGVLSAFLNQRSGWTRLARAALVAAGLAIVSAETGPNPPVKIPQSVGVVLAALGVSLRAGQNNSEGTQ